MSMRLKIVVCMAALVIALGIGGTLYVRMTLSNLYEDELEMRSLALARDLEGWAGELLLTNDSFSLYSHVNDLASNNEDVSYIVVFDDAGTVHASTFPASLPQGLREANSVQPGEPFSLTTLNTSRGAVIDTAYPISGGRVGSLRVGLSKERAQDKVNDVTVVLLALTGAVFAAGLAVAYLLATLLTRPLSRLAAAAQAVGAGNLSVANVPGGRDETGRLAGAFNRMKNDLRQKEAERRQLMARVMSAEEDERKRISRELHDEAGQALTSVLLGLKAIEDTCPEPDQRSRLAGVREMVASTLDLMHDIAVELRPSALDDLGLIPALENYVADFGRKYPIATDFHSGGLDGVRLKPQAETALYRIAQEALTNAAKHANATSVSVALVRRNGLASLVIEDDGRGFDQDELEGRGSGKGRLGLAGMRERAALAGGSITVESAPGSGTTVFVEVPIDASEN